MGDLFHGFVKKKNGGAHGVDMLRYSLTQIAPEPRTVNYLKGFPDAVNSELVSILGIFVNPTFVLMHKLCKEKVPKLHQDILDDNDRSLVVDIENTKGEVQSAIEHFRFRDALFQVIDLSRKGNQYLQKKEPWIKAKALTGDPESEAQRSIDNTMHLSLQLCANLAILINPFLPNTARKMLSMMKVVDKMLDWENAGKLKLLSVGYSLREPQLLFRKIEDEEIKEQMEKLNSGSMNPTENNNDKAAENKPALPAGKAEIQYDDFAKLDLKAGTVISCEKVEKADKLLKLEVDLGHEKRTIVSGIAQHYKPEEMVGKQVIVVTNLAPRKMKGIESPGNDPDRRGQ